MKWWMYFLLASVAMAQQPAPEPTALAALEGRVLHGVTQEPLRKAHVVLELKPSSAEHDSVLIATTDDAGRFRFADVKPGAYLLTAEKTGFLGGEYGKDKPEDSLLTVNSGDKLQNLTLHLFPGGIISGRILDADGDPAPDKQVMLLRQHHRHGKTIISEVNQTATDTAGEYRFDKLLSGAYYVSAAASPWDNVTRQILVDGEGKRTKIRDLTTFYPSALSSAEAQAIQLGSGQEQVGIDLRIQRGPTFSIKGKITAVSNPLSGYSLRSFMGEGMGGISGSGKILPTGDFVFEDLPPGKHRLYLFQQGGNGGQRVGRTEVNLTEQDVIGAVITPFKPAQVRVRVVQEGKEDQPLTAGSVFLKSADSEDQNGTPIEFQPQNGSYLFPGVIPGAYQVWFNNASDGYLKSIQAGGRKLDTNRIEIAESSNLDLLLTFSKNVATVSGEVEIAPDLPKPSVRVLLIGEEPSLQLNKNFPVSLDQFLHFTKERMPPGKYLALAVEDDADLWDNPELVKLLQSKGTEVKLGESETATLHLKLIPKEETDRARRQLGLQN